MNFWKFVFTLLSLHFQSISGQSEVYEEDPRPGEYVIVVDGGIARTRLHVFHFNITDLYPKLISTSRFRSIHPFSQFTKDRENWNLLRIMINNLTSQALDIIPEELVNKTHIYVQVTAGVRQLETRIGQRILNHIRHVLYRSKLFFQAHFVDILSIEQEGRFAWVSLNYLLDKFEQPNNGPNNTVGMVYLGAGSTQISLATTHPELTNKSERIELFGQEYHVYTDGYDHLGINEIRLKYFNVQSCVKWTCEGQILLSPCLPHHITRYFQVGNRSIEVGGQPIDKGQNIIYFCQQKPMEMTLSVMRFPRDRVQMEFVGIATVYRIAKESGAKFTKTANGLYQTSLYSIGVQFTKICAIPNFYYKSGAFDHFLCIDTTYVFSLLRHGYGMQFHDKLSVGSKIKGTHISWALGYALSKF